MFLGLILLQRSQKNWKKRFGQRQRRDENEERKKLKLKDGKLKKLPNRTKRGKTLLKNTKRSRLFLRKSRMMKSSKGSIWYLLRMQFGL